MSPTRLEGMETASSGGFIVASAMSPTRLEGMETCSQLSYSEGEGRSPTRLEGMETFFSFIYSALVSALAFLGFHPLKAGRRLFVYC